MPKCRRPPTRRLSRRLVAIGAVLLLAGCAEARPLGPAQPPPQAALPPPAAATDHFFTTTDGVRLHYTDAGRGAPMVFVPGWDMPGWIFAQQTEEFSRTYRVIAFDPRGQGDSDIPSFGYEPHRRGQDIAELVATIGRGPVVLVGWSLGVLDVLAYAADHGDARIASLILLDNSVGETPAPPPLARTRRSSKHARPVPREVAMHAFVAAMFRTRQPADYLDRLTDATLRVPAAASAALLAYPVPRVFWRDAIYSVHRPILYIVRPTLAAQAQNLAAGHADTQSVVLTGVGHAMFVDDPERIDALIRDFLRRRVYAQ